jgi:glycerol-3-phosphate cytidylyltransferase-like family protein
MLKNKILKISDLKKTFVFLRNKNLKIIHCHGVFDLLHIGHIRHFKKAKSYGDFLIVTLTTDKFFKN